MSLDAREQRALVEAHVGLGRALAHAAVRRAPHLGHAELSAVAAEALVLAARRYDPARAVPFHTFAFPRVRGALIRAVRRERSAWVERLLVAEHDARPLLDADGPAALGNLADSREAARQRAVRWARETAASAALAALCASPEVLVATAEGRARALAALRAAVTVLDGEERRFVELYYERGATLDEAARELGFVKRTAQRLHDRVKTRLAFELGRHGVTEAPDV